MARAVSTVATKNGDAGSPADDWQPARLIPTAGIRGQEEQERRATSCLLAVIRAVPDFGFALLGDIGAPKGRLSTYAEIRLHDAEGKLHIPDGAIVVERGKTRWCCLVEVKTGAADLQAEQVGRYLDLARAEGFDAVLTISNQITSSTSDSPVAVDKRKRKRVALHHLSWWRIITTGIVEHRHRGVSDPDQAWILGELIAYLDHEASGASGFQDMGDGWVRVRDAARQQTLRPADPEIGRVADRWMQFIDFLCLGLSQDLGRDVRPQRGRNQAPEGTRDRLTTLLADAGKLAASIRVPDAVAPLALEADLRTRQVTTSVALDAPREGRPLTRIKWIVRQLAKAPAHLRIDVSFANTRETTSLLLSDARARPEKLLSATDPKRDPRTFVLALTRPMGLKRGRTKGSFVHETREQAVDFYRDLVQNLEPWRASAPRLPAEAGDTSAPSDDPPPFSAVDARDIGDAATARDEVD